MRRYDLRVVDLNISVSENVFILESPTVYNDRFIDTRTRVIMERILYCNINYYVQAAMPGILF